MNTSIRLFISRYKERSTKRAEEIRICHDKNKYIFPYIGYINDEGKRTTYQDVFDRINFHIDRDGLDGISVVANSDIYFDETIKLCSKITQDECYALTRYNVLGEEKIEFEDTPGSQDVWIFRGKIKDGNFDIPMGIPGCDNRIAHELSEAGYKLYNPSKAIKTYHLHKTPKSYDDSTERIPPPYHLVPVIEMPKKVFHISLGTHQKAQIRALKSLGTYDYIDWTLSQNDLPKLHGELMSAIQRVKPEVIFMQLQREGIVRPDMVREWKEEGIKVVNWTGDVRHPLPSWFKEVGKHCLTLFTNDHDIELMRNEGLEADYMQIGYDEKIYHPLGVKVDCPEVVFLGNNYGGAHFPLSEERRQTVKRLREELGDRFGLYGSGWPDGWVTDNFNNDEVKEAQILRSAKIVVNVSHFNYGRYSSDRLWRALGCGAMVISHHYKDMEMEFKTNHDMKVYHNFRDLPGMCIKYLNEEEERKQIAINGWRKVKNSMTWAHRIESLNQWI